MIGLDGRRVYLDWNATAPLRPEARAAMLEAMDVVGNPSSVHAEGRAARAVVERARSQVAELAWCDPDQIVFTSGATEAAAMILSREPVHCAGTEHDCVEVHRKGGMTFPVDRNGVIVSLDPEICRETPGELLVSPRLDFYLGSGCEGCVALASSSGETGVVQDVHEFAMKLVCHCFSKRFTDLTQSAGKQPLDFDGMMFEWGALSSHKLAGPKGVGALLSRGSAQAPEAMMAGGGQEKGRRSGTENVIGIAGFGAAAEAAKRDLEAGVWERVENLRIILENSLADAAPDLIVIGHGAERLPNTSCVAVPGWKGETQVMQMDLAGFAISAGSACSSGKVRESRVLRAMGFDAETASSAIRISMGPTTTEAEVRAFARAWSAAYAKRRTRVTG